uniref:Uncharacterized protein n=1 Tax=Photinus pyralis TaxID=7054 RepID=A0A1Y1K5G2_PHOPY
MIYKCFLSIVPAQPFLLGLVTKLGTAGLGLEIVVSLSSPLHQVVSSNQRREPVEYLALGTTERVEESIVNHASSWVLSVGGKAVVDDALLLGATKRAPITQPVANLPIRGTAAVQSLRRSHCD